MGRRSVSNGSDPGITRPHLPDNRHRGTLPAKTTQFHPARHGAACTNPMRLACARALSTRTLLAHRKPPSPFPGVIRTSATGKVGRSVRRPLMAPITGIAHAPVRADGTPRSPVPKRHPAAKKCTVDQPRQGWHNRAPPEIHCCKCCKQTMINGLATNQKKYINNKPPLELRPS